MEERPPDHRPGPKRRSGFALRILLDQYNSMLGWTYADLAGAMGKDTSWLSKIATGKSHPHDSTLMQIAQAYYQAGLTGITTEMLIEARDRMDDPRDSLGIPDQWKRLIFHVLAMPEDVQEALFAQFSVTVVNMANILRIRHTPKQE